MTMTIKELTLYTPTTEELYHKLLVNNNHSIESSIA
jgi:hypothetical protein